jgi:hypothetical protein
MAPNNCARISSAPVSQGRAPMRAIATVTFTSKSAIRTVEAMSVLKAQQNVKDRAQLGLDDLRQG